MRSEYVFQENWKEYEFLKENCGIVEIWNRSADPQVSIARARVAPGQRTRPHSLDGTTERYLIVSGSGRAHIEGAEPRQMRAGDLAVIPPGAVQWIENIEVEDLVFYAICTPRFQMQNYRDRSKGKSVTQCSEVKGPGAAR